MEMHYVFLKNDRVANIAVFDSKNDELATKIAEEQGFDKAIWVAENKPAMYSSYDGKKFIDPSIDYLFEIGIAAENQAMYEARIAAEQIANEVSQ